MKIRSLLSCVTMVTVLAPLTARAAGDDAFPYSADPNTTAKPGTHSGNMMGNHKDVMNEVLKPPGTGPGGEGGHPTGEVVDKGKSNNQEGDGGHPQGDVVDHGRDNHLGNADTNRVGGGRDGWPDSEHKDQGGNGTPDTTVHGHPPNMNGNHKDVMEGVLPQGHQGVGLGGMTGSATEDGKGPAPQTLQLEYFSVGANPSTGGRRYGLIEDKIEFSGVSNGLPQMALETRGMSGWQLIGASDKHPVWFHLGVEPLNFEGQVTTNIVSDVKNTTARAAQGNNLPTNLPGGSDTGNVVENELNGALGNPNAPVLRQQYMYYVPAVSAGVEVRKAGCRFLALVRAGAAGGAMLRTDNGYSYGVGAAYGAGLYVNCAQFDVDGEWTRIQQSDAPIDLINIDAMYKPFRKLPLAVGVEVGSTVTNSQDPKSVPYELPGYGVKGAEVETHGSGVVRLVF